MTKYHIHSITLSERNESVYKRFFNSSGRNGVFSKWVNDKMNKEFTLNGVEHLKNLLQENTYKQEQLKKEEEELLKKLRVQIDKSEVKNK